MQSTVHQTIIICGSSRAGKTTLAKLTCKYSNSHNGLIFEGLFPAYLSRLSYVLKRYHPKLFDEYLERPRFIDEGKSKTLAPIEQLDERDYSYKGSFMSSLHYAFGENWVIADLHAELYYKALLRALPNIYFCVVIRDPRDCVCAGLYWQDYPNARKNRKSWFYKRLFSWILSAHIAEEIKQNHPENISVINFNQIKNNETAKQLLGLKEGWDKDLPEHAYYSFIGEGQFTTPDKEGKVLELLTVKERAIIQNLCADMMQKYGYAPENLPSVNIATLKIVKTMVIAIAKLSPSLARGFIDLLFSPVQHARKQLERLKQLIKDIKNF